MVEPRFIRDYELIIGITGGDVRILPPLRVSFSAHKSIRGGLNKMNVRVFNLAEDTRRAIVKEAEESKRIAIALAVGYKSGLEKLFQGTVHVGSNAREGADIVSEFECLDGGFDFLNSFTSKTLDGGDIVEGVLEDMPNTSKGKAPRKSLNRPRVMVGATARFINDLIEDNETWYIENEQLYILKNNEVVTSFTPVVNADTGLIKTPTRKNKIVTVETLLNPSIIIGGRFKLISNTAPHLDGLYRAETIEYSGDSMGSDWNQTITGLPL